MPENKKPAITLTGIFFNPVARLWRQLHLRPAKFSRRTFQPVLGFFCQPRTPSKNKRNAYRSVCQLRRSNGRFHACNCVGNLLFLVFLTFSPPKFSIIKNRLANCFYFCQLKTSRENLLGITNKKSRGNATCKYNFKRRLLSIAFLTVRGDNQLNNLVVALRHILLLLTPSAQLFLVPRQFG